MRYTELNPVRAAMIDHPKDYRWSSYRANALGKSDDLITPHNLYRRLGPTAIERQKANRQLFKHHIGESTLSMIRESTNKSWALGGDRFQEKIQRLTERQTTPTPRGGDRKSEAFRETRNLI